MPNIHFDSVSVSYYVRSAKLKSGPGNQLVGGELSEQDGHLRIQALTDVTTAINVGERVGLVGTNGSGKSTFLKTCSRGLLPDTGTLRINGEVSAQLSLGGGIKPLLSGRQNVELKCLYMRVSLRKIGEMVEIAKGVSGLGEYFELPVQTYSAGMRTRLAMSFLTLLQGEILVMDEWIGAADPTVNEAANYLQTKVLKSASILLIASHSESILRQWTERLIWLHKGVIRADGPIDDVYPEYNKFLKSSTN